MPATIPRVEPFPHDARVDDSARSGIEGGGGCVIADAEACERASRAPGA